MNFWQWVQILVSIGAMLLLIKFRDYLRNEDRFSQTWNVVSGVAIGMCSGVMTDAIVIPSRLTNFMSITFLVTMIYVNNRRD